MNKVTDKLTGKKYSMQKVNALIFQRDRAMVNIQTLHIARNFPA